MWFSGLQMWFSLAKEKLSPHLLQGASPLFLKSAPLKFFLTKSQGISQGIKH